MPFVKYFLKYENVQVKFEKNKKKNMGTWLCHRRIFRKSNPKTLRDRHFLKVGDAKKGRLKGPLSFSLYFRTIFEKNKCACVGSSNFIAEIGHQKAS